MYDFCVKGDGEWVSKSAVLESAESLTFSFLMGLSGRCGRRCGVLENVDGYGEEKRFGEPKGVVAVMWCGPGTDDGSSQKAEADETEVTGL